jgi:hypothetical protein
MMDRLAARSRHRSMRVCKTIKPVMSSACCCAVLTPCATVARLQSAVLGLCTHARSLMNIDRSSACSSSCAACLRYRRCPAQDRERRSCQIPKLRAQAVHACSTERSLRSQITANRTPLKSRTPQRRRIKDVLKRYRMHTGSTSPSVATATRVARARERIHDKSNVRRHTKGRR